MRDAPDIIELLKLHDQVEALAHEVKRRRESCEEAEQFADTGTAMFWHGKVVAYSIIEGELRNILREGDDA